HDYEGLALNENEKPRLVHDLGDKSFLMLRNHGLLTAADTVASAFVAMYLFEASCAIQIRAQSGGSELITVPKPYSRRHSDAGERSHPRGRPRRAGLAGTAA